MALFFYFSPVKGRGPTGLYAHLIADARLRGAYAPPRVVRDASSRMPREARALPGLS